MYYIRTFHFRICVDRYIFFQSQEVYPELLEELQKLVASPLITETEFPATFLRSFAASGIETKLKNHVFHLMRSKVVEKWIQVGPKYRFPETILVQCCTIMILKINSS
jgi:hypothetical protein